MIALDHLDDDRLLDLVNDLVPERERSAALGHVRGCAECTWRLRQFSSAHERAHARSAVAQSTARRSRSTFWLLPVAAAVAALLGGVTYLWMISRPTASPIAVAWLPVPDANVLTRDPRAVEPDARILEGLAAYREHDAGRARRLLAGARAEGTLEQVRLVYLGNAQLQLGRPADAWSTLRAVDLARVPEPWRSEAEWSLAIALTGVGRRDEADSLMRVLAQRPGAVGERARRLQSDGGP